MTIRTIDKKFLSIRVFGYAMTFLLVWFCRLNFKSGPCTPNLDIFSWFIATAVSFILLVKSIVRFVISRDKRRMYSFSIHLVAFGLLWLYGALG